MRISWSLMGLALLAGSNLAAAVKLPAVFVDNMVLQRETNAPVWGWADAGEKVTVTGSWGAKADAVADKDGKWHVALNTPKAGGPFTLTVKGKNEIVIKDVLSGEVWLCSGQSNMAFPVRGSINALQEIKNANYPEIRLFKVNLNTSRKPADNCTGSWKVCTPQTVNGFSAVGFYFGREIFKQLKDVPVGLIQSAWGGTCVEAWTPWPVQETDKFALKIKSSFDKKAEAYDPEKAKEKYQKALAKWQKVVAERKKQKKKGRGPRKPRLAGPPLLDRNYPANLYNAMIHPLEGYAIRGAIWYQGERNAHNIADATHYREQIATMISAWRKCWGQGDFPFYFVQLPNYRKPWTNPVEIKQAWPVIRESFMKAAQNVPDCDMAITIDVGEEKDIHPKNKQTVGDRLARLALNDIYGFKNIVRSGPVPVSAEKKDGKVIVTFNNGGSPLFCKGKELKGFALEDKKGKIGTAVAIIISDNQVEVSSAAITDPKMIYYAWADNPVGVNLTNKAGLPATTFRMKLKDEPGILNLWGLL